MSNFLDTLRSRLPALPKGELERHVLWMRTRAVLVSLWKPRRGDVSLPNWVHMLVGISDDGIQIPGTKVRLGLDALLGTLIPGAGDALGGATAAALMYVAWKRGAPRELLFRMLGNAAVDIGVGAIPVVGDIFDLGFHANRRNLDLLEDFLRARSKPTPASRLSIAFTFGLLILMVLMVIAGAVGLIVLLWRHFGGA